MNILTKLDKLGNRKLITAYLTFAGVFFIVHIALQLSPWAAHSYLFTNVLPSLISVVAILIGVYRHKPALRLAWIMLAFGCFLFVIGDAIGNIQISWLNLPHPFPSLADVFYIPDYPLFASAIYLMIKRHSPIRSDHGALLDSIVLTLGLTLLIWVYLVIPFAHSDITLWAKIVSILYPLGDVLILATIIRLLTIDHSNRSVLILAIGFGSLLASDVVYGLSQLIFDTWSFNLPTDALWMIFYTMMGLAALHPSMRELDKPFAKPFQANKARPILLAASALIPLVVLNIEYVRGQDDAIIPMISVFAAAIFIIVIIRLYILLLESAKHRAEATIAKQRSELMYLASHQLRTPASSVKDSLAQLLDGDFGKLTEKQRAELEQAQRENAWELDLVNSILRAMQLESDEMSLTIARIDVADLVASAIEKQQLLLRTRKHRVINDRSGNTMAEIDRAKLAMAIDNLLTNAIKYTPDKGLIEIMTEGDADVVVITIRDSGVGISDEDQTKIFKRFSRGGDTTSNSGIGLGLYVADSLVRAHGGSIEVESRLGKGSTFTVTIPRFYRGDIFTD